MQDSNFKTVSVQYPRSFRQYTFMTCFDCKEGDKAVVFTGGNWNVVTIVEVHDKPKLDEGYGYTWLVQIVDRTEYDKCVQREHEGCYANIPKLPDMGSRL